MNLKIEKLDLVLDGGDLATSKHPEDSICISLFSGDWVGRFWGDYNTWAGIDRVVDDNKVRESLDWYGNDVEIVREDDQVGILIKE